VYVCTSEVCMGDTRDGGVCRSVIGSGSARKQLMCEAGRRGAWWYCFEGVFLAVLVVVCSDCRFPRYLLSIGCGSERLSMCSHTSTSMRGWTDCILLD
jgi:hypothetical protein